MPTIIDLANLGSGGFLIQGDAAGDRAGFSVSSAGDVNGDGYDDVIIGAWLGDDGGTSAGEAYVVFGHAGGFGTVDLSNLGAAGFIIQGDQAGDHAGWSVSSGGDVNGDGYDDLIVGATDGDDGGLNAGEAYVVFGHAGSFSTVDLTNLGAAGFIIQGDKDFDLAGGSVSSAGDVNGDGYDDLMVGAAHAGANGWGEAYVVFGHAGGFGTIDLANLGSAGFAIQGGADVYSAGVISSAGDVNGDGFDDMIIGAPYEFGDGTHQGEIYVIFGHAGGFGNVDLSNVGSAGFVIRGDTAGNIVGTAISSAGDINGDGFDDLVIGAPKNPHSGGPGQAYVIFGKASGFGTIDLTNLGAAGFIIHGGVGNGEAGYSVHGAGDVNGDGFGDLIVGAPEEGAGAGGAYVVFGHAGGFGPIDLANLAAADGFKIQSAAGSSETGRNVSAAGDLNGDGFDDVIVGAPYGSTGGLYSGQAYVVFGTAPTASVNRTGTDIGQTIRGGDFDDTLDGRGGNDHLFGGAGNDTIYGGDGDDTLDAGTGIDTLSGGNGNDGFFFGAAFTAADHVDGGAGTNDQIGLQGDYAGANALTLAPDTITGIEAIVVLPGFNYNLTTVDANVAAGGVLKIQATLLAAGQSLTFNGSAETDGNFMVFGGQGNDSMTGGAGNDGFYFGPGGYSGSDIVNGGAGANDQLALDGDYGSAGSPFLLGGNATNVEVFVLLHGPAAIPNHFNLATLDTFVAAGHTMTVFGLQVTTDITFDGSSEHDGAFKFYGGSGNDSFTGSDGNDWLFGSVGVDALTGGAGADTFYYDDAGQSTSLSFDRLVGFDDSTDMIDLPFAVTGFAAPASGNLSAGSFDADLATAFAGLTAHQAGMFTATGGDFAGHSFLIIDADGQAGYQAGSDYVMEIVSPVTPIDNPAIFV